MLDILDLFFYFRIESVYKYNILGVSALVSIFKLIALSNFKLMAYYA